MYMYLASRSTIWNCPCGLIKLCSIVKQPIKSTQRDCNSARVFVLDRGMHLFSYALGETLSVSKEALAAVIKMTHNSLRFL